MIINFSVENWMSFHQRVTFSMVASKERQHNDRVPKLGKYQTRVLPIAAIYGGNASGKSNFFKAISFAQDLVVKGTQPDSLIKVEPFRLSTKGEQQPSRFSFELLVDNTIYEFSFAVTRTAVLEEKLVIITSTSEKVLYHRLDGKPNFDISLSKDLALQYAFKGTRDNQLFLTNSASQKLDTFRPIYDWFKSSLTLIEPDTRLRSFGKFLDEGNPGAISYKLLRDLDTGISDLCAEDVELISLPEAIRSKLQELPEGLSVSIVSAKNEHFIFSRRDGDLAAKRLVTYHEKADGSKVLFEIDDESDGSQRVIHLLPAIYELTTNASKKVFVIDELDRSLHTLLTRKLLEIFLDTCSPESRAQLLLTTHDVLLMNQHLLRRDEMWVAERDSSGASSLTSFGEFRDVRYDKDIRKSYLQGRLGGVPRFRAAAGLGS